MLRTIWDWTCLDARRTWYAHGFIALAGSMLVAAAVQAWAPAYWHSLAFPVASGLFVGFYTVREMADEVKYKRLAKETGKREWRRRRWGSVTARIDSTGDQIGPQFVCLAAWINYLLSWVKTL